MASSAEPPERHRTTADSPRPVEPWADWQKPLAPGTMLAYGCHLGPKDPKRRALYNDKGERVHGALFNGRPMSAAEGINKFFTAMGGGLPPKVTEQRETDGRPSYKIEPRQRPPARQWATIVPSRGMRSRNLHCRASSGRTPVRTKGSRRSSATSRAGPGSDDPPPDDPDVELHLWPSSWGRVSRALYRLLLRETRS